jgi:hypothetical protein
LAYTILGRWERVIHAMQTIQLSPHFIHSILLSVIILTQCACIVLTSLHNDSNSTDLSIVRTQTLRNVCYSPASLRGVATTAKPQHHLIHPRHTQLPLLKKARNHYPGDENIFRPSHETIVLPSRRPKYNTKAVIPDSHARNSTTFTSIVDLAVDRTLDVRK